ncbi:thioredoxin-like protein [Halenospora varia]|nr:thioredoxin-like protein [Halenospora varia]
MGQPKLTLYVDTVSPFAYEAYYILRNDPTFSKCSVEYIPIFLGGVMKACGNTPPINIKNKDKWVNTERLRWARLFNIPMTTPMPPNFPPLTLGIMRALCAITTLEGGQEMLIKALDKLYAAYWVDCTPTHVPENLAPILIELFGEETSKKITEMAAKEGKAILAKNTDKALEDGAFGLPWFVAENAEGVKECFWGVDHLGQVVEHLGLERKGKEWRSLL